MKAKKKTKTKKVIKPSKTTKAKKQKMTSNDTHITTLFMNGQSQAVRIPKEFRMNGKKVYIKRSGNCIMLIPIEDPWQSLLNAVGKFSDDFMKEGRNQPLPQERDWSSFK